MLNRSSCGGKRKLLKISLKVEKLKNCTYTFRVAGRSDAGNVVATQVKLEIGR